MREILGNARWIGAGLLCKSSIINCIVDISGCCPSTSLTIPVCDEGKQIFTRRYGIAGCPTVCVARFCVNGKQ